VRKLWSIPAKPRIEDQTLLLRGSQPSQVAPLPLGMWTVKSTGQITIKTPNPKCRLFWCLIEFYRLVSYVGIFDPSCKLSPLYLLSSSPPPPPLPVWKSTYRSSHCIQCVTGAGGMGYVESIYRSINCVFDQIPNLQN
jgi:hypothetical protein